MPLFAEYLMNSFKRDKFEEELDGRLQKHCFNKSGLARLLWLADQEVIYINRWADFVDLRRIRAAELINNDFFCIVMVCANRIRGEAVQVALPPSTCYIMLELLRIIDVICKDYLVDYCDILRVIAVQFRDELKALQISF